MSSTATPSRSGATRPTGSRTRPASPGLRAATIDPFRVLRRHMLGIIASVFVGGVIGVGAYLVLARTYPLYTGEVLFEVRPGVSDAGAVTSSNRLHDNDVSRIANTQLQLLISRVVLEDAVSDTNVQTKTEWFQNNFMKSGVPLIQEAVDDLEEDLKTSTVRSTELFRVAWSTHNPGDVPIVLNAVARAFMTKREELDNEIHNENLDLFKGQMRETTLALMDLDQQIQDHIIGASMSSLLDARYHELAMAVEEIVTQIAQAQQRLSLSRSAYLQIAAKLEGTMEPSSEDILEAEMDFQVAPHIRAEEELKLQLRVAREKYHPDHPSVKSMEMAMRAAEAERAQKTEDIIQRNLSAKMKQYGAEIESLETMLDELETEAEEKGKLLSDLTADQSEYDFLVRQREYLEATRDTDRQLIREIQLMRLRTDAERVGIAQRALTPRQVAFPKPEIIVPLGVLLSLGVTIGVVFLREVTDQRVKSASDLAVLPGARVLGVIPDVEDDPTKCRSAELVVRRSPTSVVAESYRQVCTPLGKAIDRAGHQAVVLLAGLPGSGTTTAASNIAAAFTASGRRTLLVDANFRRPRMAEVMGLDKDRPGLGDLLAGEIELDDAVADTEWGVPVIPAGTPANRIVERLEGGPFDRLLAELRTRYELILFDTPPAVVAGDSMALVSKLDAAMLIVRANQEQRGLVGRLTGQITDHCDLLGMVLNRPRGTAGGYFKKNFQTMAAYTEEKS